MASVEQHATLRSRARATQTMNDQKSAEDTKSSSSSEVEESSREMDGATSGARGRKVAVYCFLGIFISYFVYGILQEKM